MISDNNVETALRYLAEDPHPIAVARFELTKAENATKELHARLYLMSDGTVGEREAQVEVSPEYQKAKAREAKATMEHERHRARVKAAETIIELWRTTQANARAAERVR